LFFLVLSIELKYQYHLQDKSSPHTSLELEVPALKLEVPAFKFDTLFKVTEGVVFDAPVGEGVDPQGVGDAVGADVGETF
jgi:hypothetical protein